MSQIQKAFDKYKTIGKSGHGSIKSEEQIGSFCLALGLDQDGSDLYVLGFIGESKKYGYFKENDIKKITKVFNKEEALHDQIQNYFNKMERPEYRNFLSVIYKWVDEMLKDIQHNEPLPKKENLKISKPVFLEGRTEMIQILPDLLDAIIQTKLKTDLFENFVYFITNVRCRRLLTFDEFTSIVDFLTQFKTLSYAAHSTDDTTSLPLLYDDFVVFIQTKKK
ncbi:hypothetical protein EIN_118050 [Entamoeba invadens IP1]|uniref:Uncharacterized protein n=1 Tax=Entamoeba invadens IP1 TaxID=370355 RepID=L7FNN6_ENTIV|nr:hypothetical protein EIN_118050 [Entamoeba invadens IP1]ELP92231.1 hypothetical protein EIN_118050 [Entamoeba invadens IP1]|eukprot:XP_004259002.1 hypothetical protein EIN_118050 [Entamoeba invadens IP1]